ncbi:hypothetical protein QO010_001369 [Caulobacter ginsengisoli]|uniref:Secreted protein n=1 Tax=Caulobacter ginsengisoli TaxID=400775 RepID=A0ABU0INL1_9CAUL|nr:hypothetical protein [Caulobacter ginsengisoli]MDQ0463598.1 hypothetical protein [Caulobacter ginsengisoli]
MVIWFALLLFSVGDDPAATAPAAPAVLAAAPAAAPAPAAPDDPNRVVCVKEPQAGTLFTRKICHTREEWKKLQEDRRRNADRLLDTDSNRTRSE